VYKDGDNVYAKDENGKIICQNSPTSCLQEAVNYIAQLGGGRILVKKGIYYPTRRINIPDGINLVIEGEGNTIFRYTDRFVLLRHDPESPTWSSIIILKNFKVDRSGSGTNNTDIVAVNYAKYVVYDNIEIIDDWRDSDGDAGLVGYNNLVAIAQNNRIFNKSYGIFLFGFKTEIRNNYVVNTAKVGIAGAGLIESNKLPPGFSYGGITIIENNVCIDCGRTDEAISVDYGAGSTSSYGEGIIRNNKVITMNYTTKHMLTIVNVLKAIVENNIFEGRVSGSVATNVWSRGGGTYLVFRNNYVNAIYDGSYSSLLSSNFRTTIIEGNKINVSYTNTTNNINDFFHLYPNKLIFRNNDISVLLNGISMGKVVYVAIGGSDTEPSYSIIGANSVYMNNGSTDQIFRFDVNGTFSSSRPYFVIVNNNVNGTPNNFLNFLVGIGMFGNIAYARIFGNNTNGTPKYKMVWLWANTSSSIYLDTDIPNEQVGIYSALVSLYRLKRNEGTATIPANATSITVNHGMACTPTKIFVTPLAQPPGPIWISNITDTSFTINTSTAPTTNLPIAWYTEC
jgi:hypothetical protein